MRAVMTWLWLNVWLVLTAMTPFGAAQSAGGVRARPTYVSTAVPVVVELFTSEGCSSCPAADEVLTRLVFDQAVAGVHVIGLSEHVDYWDRLGWRDPFSSAAFTARQGDYAVQAFRAGGAYTPQIVVDGRQELIGSDYRGVVAAINAAARQPRAKVQLTAVSGTVIGVSIETEVSLDRSGSGPADVIVGITEDGLSSDVRRGENRGRHLRHSAVVRVMKIVGSVSPGAAPFARTLSLPRDPAWNSDLRVFAFVQNRASRRILGASEVGIAPAAPSE